MHGIARMSKRVLKGLMDRGHTCVVYGEGYELFDERIQISTNIDDGDILLLPANGLVGVSDKLHETICQCSIPITSIIYDIIPYVFNENKEQRYERAIKNTMSWSRNIITISNHSANDIHQHLGACDLTVIHPGVPFDPPEFEWRQPDDYFLSVGGYGERKGHTELLEAVLETNEQLIMVGIPFYYDQKTRDLAGKAISRGLLVELSGVPDDVLISLYQYAKAMIYPTKYEGFGLPVIEAMSCGCPVITTELTATKEAAGDAAHFIAPNTWDIIGATRNFQQFRESLITKGLQQAAKFNWEEIASNYEKALDKN